MCSTFLLGVSRGACEGHGDWRSTHISLCSQISQSCSGLPGNKHFNPVCVCVVCIQISMTQVVS